MGSSQSTKTTNDGLSQQISELTKGNPNAVALAKVIDHLPTSDVPVDDNIAQFMEDNAAALIDEIRSVTGLTSDAISSKDILTMALTARRYGIMAIPYVAGIIGTVAGTPAAGAAAGAAAGSAVAIAEGIEKALYNVAARTQTPDFLKKLPSAISYGKRAIWSVIEKAKSSLRLGGAEDPYEIARSIYGAKAGACDCVNGAAEEPLGLLAAREYLKTSSSAAKNELSRAINSAVQSIIKETPPAGLSDVETANWYLSHMLGTPGNPRKFSEDKVHLITSKLVEIINNFVGKKVIDESLPIDAKISQAAEILHSLTVSMKLEYLIAQGDIIRIEGNMEKIINNIKDVSDKIIDLSGPGMTEGDRQRAAVYSDAIRISNDAVKVQFNMLRALTTGTMGVQSPEVEKLLAAQQMDYAHVIEMSSNPSDHYYTELLYKLLNMMIVTGTMASFFEKAAVSLGTTLEDYRKMSNLSELSALLEKIPDNASDDLKNRMFEAYELLSKNFDRRHEISKAVKGAADDEYPKSAVTIKIENAKNMRSIKIKAFADRLGNIYRELGVAISKMADHTASDIPAGEKLELFIERLDVLSDDAVLKGKTYLALSGAVKDAVALQVRGELIGRLRTLLTVTNDLMAVSNGAGKDALGAIAMCISNIIKASDDSSENFGKVTGAADISDSITPEVTGLSGLVNSAMDLAKAIDKMKANVKIAKVRENIKNVRSNFEGVTVEYEQLNGQAIGGVITDINDYQRSYLQRLSGADKVFQDFIANQCESMRGIWKAAEAIDYLLGNFTHDIRLSSAEVSDIASLLEDVSLIRDMYDDKTGDLFTSIFDSFPYADAVAGANGNVDQLPIEDVRKIGKDAHYYSFFANDSNAGVPWIGLEQADNVKKALERSRAFSMRFGLIKNIVTIFYKLGAKYNREKTKDSTKYMQPSSLVRVLSDYLHYGSFLVLDAPTITAINSVITGIDTLVSSHVPVVYADFVAFAAAYKSDLTKKDATDFYRSHRKELNKIITDNLGVAIDFLDFVSMYHDDHYRLIKQGFDHDQANNILTNPGTAIGSPSLYMRSETFKYLCGLPPLTRTDDMFVTLFKSMLTKILSCVEAFEIHRRPAMYNIYNSAVRQIIGGADAVEMRQEYIPLYIRLPWMVRFYKKILGMDGDQSVNKLQAAERMNKSASRMLKISVVPDIDGLYGPLVSFVFKTDKLGFSLFTTSQLEQIISLTNKIIDATEGANAEEKIKKVINGLKDEVNRRFAIVTKEDYEEYKKLTNEENNLWGALVTPGEVEYMDDSNMLSSLDRTEPFMGILPSAGYVSTSASMYPGSVLPKNARRILADRKYYKDYADVYNNFRNMMEGYIIDDVARETSASLKKSIKSVSKAINAEPNVTKKLDMLSDFIKGEIDLSDHERDKYVAFHELVITGMNSLSILDAYLTNIISIGYMVDPLGFGKALVYNRNAAAITTADIDRVIRDPSHIHTGISLKTIHRVCAAVGGALRLIAAGAPTNTLDLLKQDRTPIIDFGTIGGNYVSVLGRHIIAIIYSLMNNPLFDVRVSESGVNIDASKARAEAEKLYASLKSTIEKFRPHVDPAFLNMYTNIFNGNVNKNTVYQIYDDLFRVKFDGQTALANANDLDKYTGNYYGISSASVAISNFMKNIKGNVDIMNTIKLFIAYDPSKELDAGVEAVNWAFTGSGIDRMHVAFNGDKMSMDLRFAARQKKLYKWEEANPRHLDVFRNLNALVARLLGRSFDSGSEKVYKGVLAAFEKAFPAEISNPYSQGWPDIWPGLYRPTSASANVKAIVTEKDSFSVGGAYAANMFYQGRGGSVPPGTVAIVTNPNDNRVATVLGYTGTAVPNARHVNLPEENRILYASIANIVKNILGNKNAAGGPLNIAETFSEIGALTKDRMRDDLPLLKGLFRELVTRCMNLRDIVRWYGTDGPTPEVIAGNKNIVYPSQIREPSEKRAVSYYGNLVNRIHDIAIIFEKTVDDLMKELQVSSEYGELYPGFLAAYRQKYSGMPFIPPSLGFGYVFAHKINEDDSYKAFYPAEKKSVSRYLANFSRNMDAAGNSWMVQTIIDRFNLGINGPEKLREEDVRGLLTGSMKILKMVGDARAFKGIIGTSRLAGTVNNDMYPEDIMNGTYSPLAAGIDIVSPWALSFVINDSVAYNPGIVLSRTVNRGYMNSMFITDTPSDFLGAVMINDPNEQVDKIFKAFNMEKNNYDTKINKIDVANILDLNIIPIDFSQFSRFMPLAHLMNYSYTFDRIVLDALVPDAEKRRQIYESIVQNGGFNPTSSEMLIAALLMNPWNPNVTWKPYRGLFDNMMRGNTQLKLGRPKFLSDQLYQKALFGEMFRDGDMYDERGSANGRNVNTISSVFANVANPTFSVKRGGTETDPVRQGVAGWSFMIDRLTGLSNDISAELMKNSGNVISMKVNTAFAVDKKATVTFVMTHNVNGDIGSFPIRCNGSFLGDEIDGLSADVDKEVGAGITGIKVSFKRNGNPIGSITSADGYAPAVGDPLAATVNINLSNAAVNISMTKDPYDPSDTDGTNIAVTTNNDIRDARIKRSHKFIIHVLNKLRTTKVPENTFDNIAGDIDNYFRTHLVRHNDYESEIVNFIGSKGYMKPFTTFQSAIEILGRGVGVDVMNDGIRAIYCAYMYENEKDALAAYAKGGPATATTSATAAVREIEKIYGKAANSDLSRKISVAPSSRDHPLRRYFNPSKPVNATSSAKTLSYIDPSRDGENRIVNLEVANTTALRQIGYARNNTILVRLMIFMMNAYRVVLYRLREDSKVRTGVTASRPEEILDDGLVEFSGFDMME